MGATLVGSFLRAREPSLRVAVELQRKQRVEKENRARKQIEEAEAHESRRKERAANRQALKERYGHSHDDLR